MLAFVFCLASVFAHVEDNSNVVADTVKRPNKKSVTDSLGYFVHINRIFIVGNRVTRDQIILRELSIKPGDIIYSTDLSRILELDQKKLINTRLFNTVEIRQLELQPDRIDLLINVNERWYTFPSPIFELSDRNFNEWWENYDHDLSRVNYGLKLYQFNMRGRNETLRLLAQFGFTRRLMLTYRIPYIDRKQRHGLALDLDYAETKNLSFQTFDHKLDYLQSDEILRTAKGFGLTYTYRPSFYESHAVKTQHYNVSINDTVALLNPNFLGDGNTQQQYTAIAYSFMSDHRDYVGYPLTGYYIFSNMVKTGLLPADDINKFEVGVNVGGFVDLSKGFYLSLNAIGFASTRNNIPYSNFSALGYQKQFVRGYEVYVIEGPSYALAKTTFKKRLFSKTYHWRAMPIPQFRHIPISVFLKTFADIGYVNSYSNYSISNNLNNRPLSGVGLGIDIVGSYDAVFRFEYSFNAEGEGGFFFHVKKEF